MNKTFIGNRRTCDEFSLWTGLGEHYSLGYDLEFLLKIMLDLIYDVMNDY